MCLLVSQSLMAREVSSNRNGGGAWSAAGSWKGGALPVPSDSVLIAAGDRMVLDLGARQVTCQDVKVQKGAVLEVRGRFVPGGTVSVEGTLRLQPGSVTEIACEESGTNGIEIMDDGQISAQGCTITSFVQDGKHNGYVAVGSKWGKSTKAEFIGCEISYLGRGLKRGERAPRKRAGLHFLRIVTHGPKIVGCDIHHMHAVDFCIAANAEVRDNDVHHCQKGLSIFQFRGFRIAGNRIHHNRLGFYCHVDVARYENVVENNDVHHNRVGVQVVSPGKTVFRRNRYHQNKTGLILGAFPEQYTHYLEGEALFANGIGIQIATRTKDVRTYALQTCVLGEDGQGQRKPNTEADISLPARSRPEEVGVEIVMDKCKLSSPRPIANVRKGDSIVATDHNQKEGEEKVWEAGE